MNKLPVRGNRLRSAITAIVAGTLFSASAQSGEQNRLESSTPICDGSTASACDSAKLLQDDFGITGDWFGRRSQLAENGITFDGNVTGFYYGVAHGGLEREFRFAGHGDYVFNLDGGKLGIQEGFFVKTRAEHRFGESINNATGTLMPATVLADLPVADSNDIYITNLLVTQAFSENFAVFAGKLDTLDGDFNRYAHGRGRTQFSNMAMVANPILLRTVPYSTLGMGFVVMQDLQPVFTFTVLNPTDTTKSSGISHLYEDGVTLNAEGRIKTHFLGKEGNQLFGAAWSSKTYTSLGQDPRIITGRVPIAESEGSWALYHNFDQQLIEDRCDPTRGWGIFGRSGIGDADTNPLQYFLSFGVGGSSLIHGREHDSFGIGWYYLGSSSEIGPLLSRLGDGQGVEMFYNYRLNRNVDITPDMQVLMPGMSGIDTALGVGLRANIRL